MPNVVNTRQDNTRLFGRKVTGRIQEVGRLVNSLKIAGN